MHGRRRLEIAVLLLGVPLLWLWLRGKGISILEFAALAGIVAINLHVQIVASLYATVPLIMLDTHKVQFALLGGAATRLLVALAQSCWFTLTYLAGAQCKLRFRNRRSQRAY